jgi:hypothetical protein
VWRVEASCPSQAQSHCIWWHFNDIRISDISSDCGVTSWTRRPRYIAAHSIFPVSLLLAKTHDLTSRSAKCCLRRTRSAPTSNISVLCGVGLEYLHSSLVSRKRSQKTERCARGFNWVTLFLGENKHRSLAVQVWGGSELRESRGNQTRERQRNYRSPSLQSGSIKNTNPQLSKYNFHGSEKKNWSRVPDGGLISGQTGRLTVVVR